MIIKSFEINKINLKDNKFILLYGKNDGLKLEVLKFLLKGKTLTANYDEKEIIENSDNFLNSLHTESLFENEKIMFIKRVTDKSFKILEHIVKKNLNNINIIIESDNLEKKSKLRSFFEKDKKTVCIPVYPDDFQSLSRIAFSFLKQKKISLSKSNIDLIINNTKGDRGILISELKKIENYSYSKKSINEETLLKLTNLIENHSISELIDNCLAKNKNKTFKIINENNYKNDDCVLISRTFLNKSKRILALTLKYEKNRNIDLTISEAKPPIFWKEKQITKQQIQNWNSKNLKFLIYQLCEVELMIKKNLNNSLNIITNFILEQVASKTNN
ncbi:DNA polymerase III subunit delta [Candidatus Pelagibacter sp.]|uniref:DNA polymerase III subunit delta n=1 Tax=Candidatus Pelagibacter sp. TaxID=2024849 RepID=UPI003D107493